MKIEKKQIISWLRENLYFDPYSYSGRGMFGSKCLAVNCESAHKSLWDLTKELAGGGLRYYFEPPHPDSDQEESDYANQIINMLGTPEIDSMGRGQVLYFPKFKVTDEDLDE